MSLEFYNPQKVFFDKSRWVMTITVTDSYGVEHNFVASAGIDQGNSLYFGTLEEYQEDLDYV